MENIKTKQWIIPSNLKSLFFEFFDDEFLNSNLKNPISIFNVNKKHILLDSSFCEQDIMYINCLISSFPFLYPNESLNSSIKDKLHNSSLTDPFRMTFYADALNYKLVKEIISFINYEKKCKLSTEELLYNPNSLLTDPYVTSDDYKLRLSKAKAKFLELLCKQDALIEQKNTDSDLIININITGLHKSSLLSKLDSKYNELIETLFEQNLIDPNFLIKEHEALDGVSYFDDLMTFPDKNKTFWLLKILEKNHLNMPLNKMFEKYLKIKNKENSSIIQSHADIYDHFLTIFKNIEIYRNSTSLTQKFSELFKDDAEEKGGISKI